ncbi:hypothetical protein SNE40_016320 [Patella caerulea]|uniref:Thyroglobulin type-1 domain-containing protein n=1 Tax=Patella caerulea TaxID=87958 RepID=A0AAN8JDX7_PATCE
MKFFLVIAVIAVIGVGAQICDQDNQCKHLTNCATHEVPFCNVEGKCGCRDEHVVGKREPGTCTDDDFSNCQCEHGGTPSCKQGHCHCDHHAVGRREPGTCTDDDFSNCQCEHGGTPTCKVGHCHCNHH